MTSVTGRGARSAGRRFRYRALGPILLAVAVLAGGGEAAAETDPGFTAAGVKKFRRLQPRPIELGTSGGNANAVQTSSGEGITECFSGTIGGLVLKNGIEYVVSNNHVIALGNDAEKGDPIDQPGLVDTDCTSEADNFVAHLEAWKKLRFGGARSNRTDVAIAAVIPGTVDPQGRMLRIGVPGSTILEPRSGLEVKKAGRSSGLTHGRVGAIGASFRVSFGTDADGSERSALFIDQLVVHPRAPSDRFVDGGDSGAVVVADTRDCPPWVGLLFAGSDTGVALVSPIRKVLKHISRMRPRGDVTPIGCVGGMPAAAASAASTRLERAVRRLRRVQRIHEPELLALDGVVGVGRGIASRPGSGAVLKIFVENRRPEIIDRLPTTVDGVAVEVVATGPFAAL